MATKKAMEIDDAIKKEEHTAEVHLKVLEAAQESLQCIWNELRLQFSDPKPSMTFGAHNRIQQTLMAYHSCLGKLEVFNDFHVAAVHAERKKRLAAKPKAPKGTKVVRKPTLPLGGGLVAVGATYRNPATGKEFTRTKIQGAFPTWLRAAISAGKNPDQFLVKR